MIEGPFILWLSYQHTYCLTLCMTIGQQLRQQLLIVSSRCIYNFISYFSVVHVNAYAPIVILSLHGFWGHNTSAKLHFDMLIN